MVKCIKSFTVLSALILSFSCYISYITRLYTNLVPTCWTKTYFPKYLWAHSAASFFVRLSYTSYSAPRWSWGKSSWRMARWGRSLSCPRRHMPSALRQRGSSLSWGQGSPSSWSWRRTSPPDPCASSWPAPTRERGSSSLKQMPSGTCLVTGQFIFDSNIRQLKQWYCGGFSIVCSCYLWHLNHLVTCSLELWTTYITFVLGICTPQSLLVMLAYWKFDLFPDWDIFSYELFVAQPVWLDILKHAKI